MIKGKCQYQYNQKKKKHNKKPTTRKATLEENIPAYNTVTNNIENSLLKPSLHISMQTLNGQAEVF